MSDNVGRHRAPGRYNPVTEIGQIISQAGTPLVKGSAVLAASGGLVAAIAIPAQASSDDAGAPTGEGMKMAQVIKAEQASAPTAVTAPVTTGSSTKATSSFGKLEVEPVAKPTGPTPWQLRMRAEREAERERQATAERQREQRAARAQERQEQERAQRQQEERSQASAPSRSREREAPAESSAPATRSTSPSTSSSASGPASSGSTAKSSSSSAPSSSSGDVISIAKQYIGVPYVFGGADPSGFDCSGFTQYVFGKAGTSLPRVTGAQQSAVTPVSDPQPGDLVFFGSPAYHVGIYVGDGKMIDAPRTGENVKIRSVFDGVSGYGRV